MFSDTDRFIKLSKNFMLFLLSSDLTATERNIILLIYIFTDNKEYAELSKKDYFEYLKVAPNHILNIIKGLIEKNIIIKKTSGNKKSKYKINDNYLEWKIDFKYTQGSADYKIKSIPLSIENLNSIGIKNVPIHRYKNCTPKSKDSRYKNCTPYIDNIENNREYSLSFFDKLINEYPKGTDKSKHPFIKKAIENAHLTEQDETKISEDIERRKNNGYFDNVYAKNLERYITDREWDTEDNLTFEERLKLLNS